MKNLPPNFLVVNNEGIFRCHINFEPVVGIDKLLAQQANHKIFILKNMISHPNGMIHIGVHTREGLPIFILEATKGLMTINSQYRAVKQEGLDSWISPRFFHSDHSFEMTCNFDFERWAQSGIRTFFAINLLEMKINFWMNYRGQNYRVPFGNVYEDGRICLGEDDHYLIQEFIQNGQKGWLDNFTTLLDHLSNSTWNGDAIHNSWIIPVGKLIRFDGKTGAMLDPLDVNEIVKLGVNGNPTLAEVTKPIVS